MKIIKIFIHYTCFFVGEVNKVTRLNSTMSVKSYIGWDK